MLIVYKREALLLVPVVVGGRAGGARMRARERCEGPGTGDGECRIRARARDMSASARWKRWVPFGWCEERRRAWEGAGAPRSRREVRGPEGVRGPSG
eukprot:5670515-Pyramimonas_sp.AAC.1